MVSPNKDVPTGKCAVLVTDSERTLVTNLGAANDFHADHLAAHTALPAAARAIYAEGFFATVSVPALVSLGELALAGSKPFMFNVSAQFLVDYFCGQDDGGHPLHRVPLLQRNRGAGRGQEDGLARRRPRPDRAAHGALPSKLPAHRPRTAVVTNGPHATVPSAPRAASPSPCIPIKCPRESIVDTNGAGDSFVGGFISQLLRGAPVPKCVAAGHYCAWKCLHQIGCRFSGLPDFQ